MNRSFAEVLQSQRERTAGKRTSRLTSTALPNSQLVIAALMQGKPKLVRTWQELRSTARLEGKAHVTKKQREEQQ